MKWNKFSVLGALALVAVGVIVYRPSLDIVFWTDDYAFLDNVGRLSLPDYISLYFDPNRQPQWYRPLQGMFWWVIYALSGQEPLGYHVAQVALHIANAIMIMALVTRLTARWRLAWLSALLYLALPADALAVYWPGVADPLAGLFSLLAIWFWVIYLETGKRLDYAWAVFAVVAALLSKEVSVVLPVLLFLVDVWLIQKDGDWSRWLRRYAIFGVLLLIYGGLEFTAVTRGVFTQSQGYGVGLHILESLRIQIGRLAFPWGLPAYLEYVWIGGVVIAGIWVIKKRNRRALFIGAAALLPTLPVLPFPIALAQAARYLYVPLMASAVAFAWLVDVGLGSWRFYRLRWIALAGLAAFFGANAAAINESAVNFAGTARQARQDFRPVFQRHSTLTPGTMLYFVNPPTLSLYISGMAFQRYGPLVSVYGTDRDQFPVLADYPAAFVYYLDDENNWQESSVEKNMTVHTVPQVPVQFGAGISLESIQLSSQHLKLGDTLVLLLYWRNTGRMDKDYTVFVHLVDANGNNRAGYDAQPRQGYSPTSRWRNGERLADAALIPIDQAIPAGEYMLELGLYELSTLQRLPVLDGGASPTEDKATIGPVYIVD